MQAIMIFRCDNCGYKFERKDCFERHIRRNRCFHSPGRPRIIDNQIITPIIGTSFVDSASNSATPILQPVLASFSLIWFLFWLLIIKLLFD